MVQRTVSVGLVANVNGYIANMNRAAEATRKTAAAAVGSDKQLRAQGETYGKLGTAAMAGGVLAAAGLAIVIKATADYGSKMAQLQALSKASTSDMKKLSNAAMEQGKAYGYSASQVADAEIELTKAGFSAADILGGGLKASLTLAAAGQMDVAQATGITTVALTQFGLKASDLPHVADELAAGADKALGSVGDLGEALSNGGTAAAAMKIPLKDTIGVLAAFANAGTIGAEGGTQLKSMLMQLENPSTQAKKALDALGITVYDQQGSFVGLTNLAGQLSDKLGKKSEAERNAATSTIFGSYAQNAANVLIKEGAKGIGEWIQKVDEYGFANAQAAGKMNSLSGDVQKLSASFDTNLIKAGSGANGVLRGLVQTGTNLVDAVGDIPQPVLTAGTALLAGAAAVGIIGGAVLIAVPKIALFRRELAEAGISGKAFAGTFSKGGAVVLGLTAAASGFMAMGSMGVATSQQIEQSGLRIQQGWKGVDVLFTKAGNALNAGSGLANSLDELSNGDAAWTKWLDGATGGLSHLSDVYKTNEGQLDAMGQQFAGLAKQNFSQATGSFRDLVETQKLSGDQQKTLLNEMPAYKEYLTELAGKAHVAATETNLLAGAQGQGAVGAKLLAEAQREAAAAASKQSSDLAKVTGSGAAANTAMSQLHDALAALGSTQLDARSAARGFQQAIDDASDAVKKNGKTLDITTQKGRDNQAALDAIASSAAASAAAYVKNGGSAKGAAKIVADGREAYIRAAEAMGTSRSQAKKLADQLHLIPKSVTTAVDITGYGKSADTITQLIAKINAIPKSVGINIDANGSVSFSDSRNTGTHKAAGGAIDGPGPKGKDSVSAVLAPGEHVLTADDVDAMGGQASVYRFRGALHMATGGAVGEAQRSITSTQKSLDAAQKALAADKAKAAREKKAYTQASDAAQKISGKGTTAAKHAAEVHVRALERASQAADKAATAKQSQVDSLTSKLADARTKAEALSHDREDFASTQARATAASPIDPLSYVDQLRSMSRDDNFSVSRRKSYDVAANKYEKTLVSLTTQAAAAAQKLSDVKDASTQLASSVTSSIAGRYTSSSAANVQTSSGWSMSNGVRVQTTSSALSAASLDSYWKTAAIDTGAFASQLQQLAKRGVNGQLLAQIAQDANGPQLAAALLAADASQLSSINSNFAATQTNATTAGQTVADYNYADLIAQAQTSSDQITAEIAKDGEALRKLIAQAFGLKGYAVGTPYAAAGLHPVAEQGAEIITKPGVHLFHGGEHVYTAGQTQTYMRGGGAAYSAKPQQLQVSMPQTMTLVDSSDQVIGQFKVVARDVATQVFDDAGSAIAAQFPR